MSATNKNIVIRSEGYFTGAEKMFYFFIVTFGLGPLTAIYIEHTHIFLFFYFFFIIFLFAANLFSEFDIRNRKIRTGIYFFGIKTGKWKKLQIRNQKDDLVILTENDIQKSFQSRLSSKTVNFSMYNLWVRENDDDYKKLVFSYHKKELRKLIQLAKQISAAYNIKFENQIMFLELDD